MPADKVTNSKDSVSLDFVVDTRKAGKSMSSIVDKAEKLAAKIIDLAPAVTKALAVLTAGAVIMYVKISDDIDRLSMQLGAIGDSGIGFLEPYQKEFAQFGIRAQDAVKDLQEFARVGFKGTTEQLIEMSAQMHIFSEMTGISSDEVAGFIGEMSKFGDVGIASAKSSMKSFLMLRKTFKLRYIMESSMILWKIL